MVDVVPRALLTSRQIRIPGGRPLSETLLREITEYCRRARMAESTFGRLAVNDGKLVNRLRDSAAASPPTPSIACARSSPTRTAPGIAANGVRSRPAAAAAPRRSRRRPRPAGRNFRFYDNRQKYLLFVTTCCEKWVIAQRVGMELANIHPRPAGGAPLRRRRRRRHRAHPHHARDAQPLPDDAVLHRGQGDQPRGRAPRAREDARPASSSIRRPCW